MRKERCVLTSVIETELDILKRHIDVLKTLKENQPMGIIKLSELTKYPQHMVRYSLRILEQDGLIEPSPQGAITQLLGSTPSARTQIVDTVQSFQLLYFLLVIGGGVGIIMWGSQS